MKKVLKYLSEILCAGCVGIIIDFFAHTGCIFTLLGLAIGVVFALVQLIRSKKEK